MNRDRRKVLVLSRSVLPAEWIAAWPSVEDFRRYRSASAWKVRSFAERSSEWVQPIAAAVLRDRDDRYCVIRRSRTNSRDLSLKFTIVFGGHIDTDDSGGNIPELLLETIERELEEEVGITSCEEIAPFVTVLDHNTEDSSRHFAFVYRATVDPGSVRLGAPEEFSQRSKFKIAFKPLEEIESLREKFDPWSGLLFDYMTGLDNEPRQYHFASPPPAERR